MALLLRCLRDVRAVRGELDMLPPCAVEPGSVPDFPEAADVGRMQRLEQDRAGVSRAAPALSREIRRTLAPHLGWIAG